MSATATKSEASPALAAVVVIDDEESMCEGCRQTLEAEGIRAVVARNGADGLKLVARAQPNVVVVDLKMPGMSGDEVLAELPGIDPTVVPIVITAYGSVDTAVETMKIGAFDFLSKPFDPERLIEAVTRGLAVSQQRRVAAQATPPAVTKAAADPQSAVLRGLEALSDFCALGLGERDFFAELQYLRSESRYHAEMLGQLTKREQVIGRVVADCRLVDEAVARHEYRKSALLQIMLDLQQRLHWLPRHVLKWLARRLNVPLAHLYTIGSFYEAFSFEPRGAHTIQVCTGTACHVRGAPSLLDRVCNHLGIKPGQTDPEMRFSLQTVHCMGCCALAPVLKVDNDYYHNPSADELAEILTGYKQEEKAPCRN